MITVERLDKIQQDLEWARENADRSAQTRLFVHHVPFLLTILRPIAEELDAMIAEEEEWQETSDALESEADLEKADPVVGEAETIGVGAKIKEFLSPSDDADATDAPEGDEEKTYRKAPESEEERASDLQPEPLPADEEIKSS